MSVANCFVISSSLLLLLFLYVRKKWWRWHDYIDFHPSTSLYNNNNNSDDVQIGVQRNGQEKHNGRDRGQSQKVKIKNGGEGIPEETLSGHKNIVYEASLSHSASHCICLPQVLWIYWPDFCCGSFGHHPKQDLHSGGWIKKIPLMNQISKWGH